MKTQSRKNIQSLKPPGTILEFTSFDEYRNLYSHSEGLQKIFLQVSFNSIDPSIQVNSQTINCRF